MAIEVRIIEPDEFPAWVALMNLAFFFDGDADAQAEFNRPFTDLSRVFAAFDDDCLVGTLRSFATELTTPGGVTLSASALTGVAVASTHRRRGLMTAMCTVELRASVERGEPISILIASEYPIYGRFGFGPSTWHATYTVDTGAARFVRPAAGCVELVEPTALREQVTRLYESFRLDRPGAISRRPHWWDLNLGIVTPPGGPRWKGRMVFYSSEEGEPAGYARYHIEAVRDGRQLKNTLVIDELLALTPAAYGRLWQYCCEVDLIATVRAPDRCVEEPLPWLLTDARGPAGALGRLRVGPRAGCREGACRSSVRWRRPVSHRGGGRPRLHRRAVRAGRWPRWGHLPPDGGERGCSAASPGAGGGVPGRGAAASSGGRGLGRGAAPGRPSDRGCPVPLRCHALVHHMVLSAAAAKCLRGARH